tara:strand:+ start:2105 stop:3433 length:1329 start_codon:yes stop_codon:yes gene_type:complete
MKINKFVLKQISDIKSYGIRELFRKLHLLIKVLTRIPIDIVAIVPCLLIRLIRPWIIVRIARIGAINFGNFVFNPAVYYCKKELKIDQPKIKHIDLVYIHHKDKNYNKQIEKMWKRKLNFFSSYLLDPINRVNKLIPGWKAHTIMEILYIKWDSYIDNLTDKCQPLEFTPEEEISGKKMLKKFGLKENDRLVCLAIRDGAHQLTKISSRFRNWSYHDYRHYDIDNFILAAEKLAERGYYIFRMGTVANKRFNSKNPKIIDYVNSNLRNDFLDVYLGAKCSFCISSGLGFDEVPNVFRRPIALLNHPLGGTTVSREKTLLLWKHHILKREKRRLSLSEIFSHGVAYAFDTKTFEEKGIELIDNTPEEIRDLVIEMAENLEFEKQLNSKDEELQKIFRSLFASNIKRFDSHIRVNKSYYDYHSNGLVKARFSTKFLRENKNWLR